MTVDIVREVIATEAVLAGIKAGADGAVCVFNGIVRDNTRGRRTLYLDYEAYEAMALKQLGALRAEAIARFGVREVAIVHRLGRLGVGETSVVIAVATAHRGVAVCGGRGVGRRRAVPGSSSVGRWSGATGMKLAGGALALLLTAQAMGGQASVERRPVPQNEDVPTIRVKSRLVNVAVNVADATGAPIGGLGREDFRIFEDNKAQTIAFFERESSTPLSIVLAIDGSESVLRYEGLERKAGKQFVKTLIRPQDEIDLMDFSDTVREVVSFTNEPKRIDSGLNQIEHGDETALYDAIYLASQRLGETRNDAGRRRVLVLITDGTDTKKNSRYSLAIDEAQRAGVMVYSLIIVPVMADAGRNTGGEHALIQMAQDTGGKYYYVGDPSDLPAALAHVSDDLRTQYVLGYYAPQPLGPDAPALRHIRVQLTDATRAGKDTLRYRTAYFSDAR